MGNSTTAAALIGHYVFPWFDAESPLLSMTDDTH